MLILKMNTHKREVPSITTSCVITAITRVIHEAMIPTNMLLIVICSFSLL